jgi:hypothetical protein
MIRNGSYYCKGFFIMIDNRQALELIEQAQTDHPFCGCGQGTLAVGRAGGVWLECRSVGDQPRGFIRRLVAVFSIHTRELIVDLSPTLTLVA